MQVYLAEFIGTAVLILLGNGVVANHNLKKTYGSSAGTLMITTAWGFAVFAGAMVAARISGAHLNPAVTISLAYMNMFPAALIVGYIISQFLGAMFGQFLIYLSYKKHYDETENPGMILSTFSTAPAINSPIWNSVTEIIGTAMLVLGILSFSKYEVYAFGPLLVALLVWVIGMSLGGPTGYAINPARDLGPRILHFLLPLKNKGSSNWGYAWIPAIMPIVGGLLGATVFKFFL